MDAVGRILHWGSLAKLRILFLDERTGGQLQNLDFFKLIIARWVDSRARQNDWDVVFALVDEVPDVLVQQSWDNELMSIAARHSCEPILQKLTARMQQVTAIRSGQLRNNELAANASCSEHDGIFQALERSEEYRHRPGPGRA